MDTSKYIKKCPRCGRSIEPERCATIFDKLFGCLIGFCIGFLGLMGGPIVAIICAVVGYFMGLITIMSIEDDHDMNQWFKYKCPKCGYERKEKIHTNDDPDDPSWLANGSF